MIVLSIVTSFWNQLEHSAKACLPWDIIRKNPSEPEKGLFLNYLTPPNMTSLVQSAKGKHFLVTMSVLGSFALHILIIISTSLLSLSSQVFEQNANFTAIDQFNLSRINSTYPVDSGITMWLISQYNQSYPPGTTEDLATQSFVVPNGGVSMRLPRSKIRRFFC